MDIRTMGRDQGELFSCGAAVVTFCSFLEYGHFPDREWLEWGEMAGMGFGVLFLCKHNETNDAPEYDLVKE